MARQYRLSYDGDPATDETFCQGRGGNLNAVTCRETISSTVTTISSFYGTERKCIFPFYYDNQLYTECASIGPSQLVYPIYRCPVRNITTKAPWTNPTNNQVEMINDFQQLDPSTGVCVKNPTPEETAQGQLVTLNPEDDTCFPFQRLPPFSTCKNDCPGGKSLVLLYFIKKILLLQFRLLAS